MRAETLLALHHSIEERAGKQPVLELRLGKARQWTRMLRGHQQAGQDLARIPGFWGYCSNNGEQNLSWQLQEWQFDRFASRPQSDGEDYYYALGYLPSLAAPCPKQQLSEDANPKPQHPQQNWPFNGTSVSQLPNTEFLSPEFLCALVGFLVALCEQLDKLDYCQPSILWQSLLYFRGSNDGRNAEKGGGQFLFLPPELVHFVASRSPEPARLQQLIPYQLPLPPASAPSNSARWAYALAALVFVQLCGEPPFWRAAQTKIKENAAEKQLKDAAANLEEQSHDAVMAMRTSGYIRAQLYRPELADCWDNLLQNILQHRLRSNLVPIAAPPSPEPDLSCWQQTLQMNAAESANTGSGAISPVTLWRNCNEQQRASAANQLAIERRKREQGWHRRHFWRKKRGAVALCLALAIAIGAFSYTPLKRALSPPAHANSSAYDTAKLYYTAIDKLDTQLHRQLSYKANDTVRADGNMIAVLFVNIQTRRGYEGRDVLLPAREWLSTHGLSAKPGSPIPPVSLEFVPYGIGHIEIEHKKQTTPSLAQAPASPTTIIARYDIWFPGTFAKQTAEANWRQRPTFISDLPQALQPVHYQYTDSIILVYRPRKRAWYVHNIQRRSRKISHTLAKPD